MGVFIEKFNVRWSDVDANQHVGNSTYMNFCSQTRMSFFNSQGFGIQQLNKINLSPVLLKENFVFFKEILVDQTVYVSLEFTATSEDGNIFECLHNIYDSEGIIHASSKAQGVWIDSYSRKRCAPTEELKSIILKLADSETIKIITIDDVKDREKPVNLPPDYLLNNYYQH
ncbi:acyl-CoA thioesterase [Apibacter raozihei]|uniref:acyl-CoA thioesterase n=1 Tax=Apibacter TaxID=1778601 RepID=UPI000FE39FD9|nr:MULTISPECIES: acyl-CoA thioesterase [Apibacter]